MSETNQKWIAALIAAHHDKKVFGRTRLQKEVKLLQRLGYPTDYSYLIHFYGPYSESLQSDLGLMKALGYIDETPDKARDGNEYFILQVSDTEGLPNTSQFGIYIRQMENADSVVIELAATYDAFREGGDDHEEAVKRLRRKKGNKCDGGNEESALSLLERLGLLNQS